MFDVFNIPFSQMTLSDLGKALLVVIGLIIFGVVVISVVSGIIKEVADYFFNRKYKGLTVEQKNAELNKNGKKYKEVQFNIRTIILCFLVLLGAILLALIMQ